MADKLQPPKPNQPIRAPFLRQEHTARQRQRIRTAGPLWHREGPGGTVIGIKLGPGLIPFRSTSAITTAAVSGTTITYGTGSGKLYRDTGTTLVLEDDARTIKNPVKTPMPTDTLGWLTYWSGKLWVVGWECA